MEYKGQAIQCRTLGNNIVELTFDAQGESVNKFDQNSLSELSEVVKESWKLINQSVASWSPAGRVVSLLEPILHNF